MTRRRTRRMWRPASGSLPMPGPQRSAGPTVPPLRSPRLCERIRISPQRSQRARRFGGGDGAPSAPLQIGTRNRNSESIPISIPISISMTRRRTRRMWRPTSCQGRGLLAPWRENPDFTTEVTEGTEVWRWGRRAVAVRSPLPIGTRNRNSESIPISIPISISIPIPMTRRRTRRMRRPPSCQGRGLLALLAPWRENPDFTTEVTEAGAELFFQTLELFSYCFSRRWNFWRGG
jgi:hypothetical protein